MQPGAQDENVGLHPVNQKRKGGGSRISHNPGTVRVSNQVHDQHANN